eukprot:4647520-Pyramimonas_sp.AAC.1
MSFGSLRRHAPAGDAWFHNRGSIDFVSAMQGTPQQYFHNRGSIDFVSAIQGTLLDDTFPAYQEGPRRASSGPQRCATAVTHLRGHCGAVLGPARGPLGAVLGPDEPPA